MVFWNFTQQSFRYFLNHFLGPFLARPLETHQFQIIDDKAICNDVYLKIEKLNAMLAEKNIPLVICIAYIGQIVIRLPGKFEIIDLELVVQTTPHNFACRGDGMFNSLISSVTALAFAAATVANEKTVVDFFPNSSPDSADSQFLEKIIDKVDSFIKYFGQPGHVNSSLVNDTVIERAAQLIDTLFLGATLIFRNLGLRLQCPLALNGVHRACDLRFRLQMLEINNAESVASENISAAASVTSTVISSCQGHRNDRPKNLPMTVEKKDHERNIWTWFLSKTRFFDSSPLEPPSTKCDKGDAGAPPFAQKILRFEGATLHWDLWDTSVNQKTASPSPFSKSISSSSSPSISVHDDIDPQEEFYIGPEPESMVASACLMSLPGPDNYLTIQLMHSPVVFSKTLCPPQISCPSLIDVNVDLGPLVVCLCPSQLFWLSAMVLQLRSLFEAYNTVRKNLREPESASATDLNTLSEDTNQLNALHIHKSDLGSGDFPTPDEGLDKACPTHSSRLSLSARCRLITLTLFHADEEALFSNCSSPQSISVDSSGSEDRFHEALSCPADPVPAPGILKAQKNFFVSIIECAGGVRDALFGDSRFASAKEWLEHVNSELAQLSQGRNHLRLSVGHCDFQISTESDQGIDEEGSESVKSNIFLQGTLTGRVAGLLLSECLFDEKLKPSLQISYIISIPASDGSLLPAVQLQISTGVCNVALVACILDVDPSLVDRIHRTLDALTAVKQISAIISQNVAEVAGTIEMLGESGMLDIGCLRIHQWLDEECDNSSRKYTNSSYRHACIMDQCCTFDVPPVKITCPLLRAVVRIPMPLECVSPLPGEYLDQIRERLWSQTATNSQQFPLAWWKPCLRPESLIFHVRDIDVNVRFENDPTFLPGIATCRVNFSRLEASFTGDKCDGPALLTLSTNSTPKPASAFLRIAPQRQCYLSTLPEGSLATVLIPPKVTVVVPSNDEQQMTAESYGLQTVEPTKDEDVEEELLSKVIPKDNYRSPFARRATFLEGDSQNLWDNESLSPGDCNHLKAYNSTVSRHAKFLAVLTIPSVLFRMPSEQTAFLLYSRLLHDLVLWKSLLPSEQRGRMFLKIGGGLQPTFNASDHRYWLFAEPVPLSSIYVHPSAALDAEARHMEGLRFSTSSFTDTSPDMADENVHRSSNQIGLFSRAFISITTDCLEARIGLKVAEEPLPTIAASSVIFKARSVAVTTDINPCGQPDLVYATLACGRFDAAVDAEFFGTKHNPIAGSGSKIRMPLLLPVTLSNDGSVEAMLSLALEIRSTPVSDSLEPLAPSEMVVAFKLRQACFCFWPCLHAWMDRLPRLHTESLSAEYPSLACPSYNLKIHWHLENACLHFPPVCAFDVIPDGGTTDANSINLESTPGLDSLRPLVHVQNVTAFSKFAPSSSYIAFFEKITLRLVPPQRQSSTMKPPKLRIPSGEQQNTLFRAVWLEVTALRSFLGERLASINRRSPKILDLDHVELRFVSEDLSSGGANQICSPCVDVRLTNNLFRVTACFDSLVALWLALDNFNQSIVSQSLRKPSACPVLVNPISGDGSSNRSKIADLISVAVSDTELTNRPRPRSPPYVTVSRYDGEFVVIGKEAPQVRPVTRQPMKILKDGTHVISYSSTSSGSEHFYPESKGPTPMSKLHGLFSDPHSSESIFAFTIHDVSIEFTFFGGLDFPSLCSGTDVEEILRQSLSINDNSKSPIFCRQPDQTAILRLSNVYFRKSIFNPPANYRPYYHRTTKMSTSSEPWLFATPIITSSVTRYALRIADLQIVDNLPQSIINHLLHVQQQCRARQDGRLIDAVRSSILIWPSSTPVVTDYEAEGKISIQPLQINLDQSMLTFLRAYHAAFTKLAEQYLQDMKKRVSLLYLCLNPAQDKEEAFSIFQVPSGDAISEDKSPPVFIRRLTLTPCLPIRFNYYGHQLDLSQGTLIGLLALFLRLKNAELILPQWVYQRGYKGVACLIEDITLHWMSTLHSNLLQILATSVGPMHEISSILIGVRDFVLHSVNAFSMPVRSLRYDSRKQSSSSSSRSPADEAVQDLRNGLRALSDNAVWPVIELSSQGVRTVQSLFETVFDILSPGPSIRTRRLSPIQPRQPTITCTSSSSSSSATTTTTPGGSSATNDALLTMIAQPKDLREGVSLAVQTIRRGVAHFASDLTTPRADPNLQKGSVGALGDVLRQIPPTTVVPFVIGCEVGANLLDGLRNQLRPEAKHEDREKWKTLNRF